jgi:MFS family permease
VDAIIVRVLDRYLSLNYEVRILLITTFASGVFDGLLYMGGLLQLYLKSAGYGGGDVGLFIFINGLVSSILVIPSGYLADVFGRRRIALISAIPLTISTVLIAVSPLKPFIAVSAFLGGLGSALIHPSLSALMADKARDDLEATYSVASFLLSLGIAIGGFMGWIPEIMVSRGLTYFESYRVVVFLAGIICLATYIPLLFVSESRVFKVKLMKIHFSRLLLKILTLNVVVGLGAGFSIPLLSYYLSLKFNVESGPIGTLNAIASIIQSLSFLTAPLIAELLRMLYAIVIPQALATILLATLPFTFNFTAASAILVARTTLMNMVNPLWSSILIRSCSKEERATVISISTLLWNLPYSLTAQLGGIIMDYSLDTPIFITSIIYMIYISLTLILLRREKLN